MSLLYYNAIYGKINVARALMDASQSNFKLFEDYIKLAIDSQKRKKVSARWRRVENGKEVAFTPQFSIIEIELDHTIRFQFQNAWYEVKGDLSAINANNPLIFVSQQKFVPIPEANLRFSDDRMFIQIDEKPLENEIVLWGSTQVTLSVFTINARQISLKQKNNSSLFVKQAHIEETESGLEVTASLKGNLNPHECLLFNGFEINHWSNLTSSRSTILDKDGKELNIIQQNGSIFYIDGIVKKDTTELFMNQFPVDFKQVQAPSPQIIQVNGVTCKIANEEGKRKIYDQSISLSRTQLVSNAEFPELLYQMEVREKEDDKFGVWIELIDDTDNDDANYSTFSPVDYFFEDGVTELEESSKTPYRNRKRFTIKSKNTDERKLKLASTNFKNPRISYEDLPDELFIPINTYQLEKQREAIEAIKNRPLVEHQKLLGLTERKEQSHITWKSFQPAPVEEWMVLKDLTREGTEKQRSFVQKALATDDFVLLEGPPGSGKTTAIIELILQLIRRKKRILLSASTHVAIDNVLERLQSQNLMEGILPLRIGDDNNMSDAVKDFSINNIEGSPYKDLVIDSANLVCGTTIGILQHPQFKNAKGNDQPTVPKYDYLIIDESSKTTFQEFLVPALYAERWVLVGDVRQLSPYTDREHLVANFETFITENGTNVFSKNDQKASLLLFKYVYQRQSKMKYCIVESDEIVKRMKKELLTRGENKGENAAISSVAFLQAKIEADDVKDHTYFYTVTEEECRKGSPHSWILPTVDCLLIKQSELQELKRYIPVNMIVLNRTNWESEPQFYRMDAFYNKNGTPGYQERPGSRMIKDIAQIAHANNDYLKNKRWSEELVWRMVRLYELQYTNKTTNWLETDIQNLTPVFNSDFVLKKYEVVKDISLPSILESLKVGVGKRRESDRSTVLNSGFDPHVRKYRYEILDYQHRMHPEISEFPRQQFYNEDSALRDSSMLQRDWSYTRYKSRDIWIDVEGSIERNYNLLEAKRVIEEVKHFVNWAKSNPKNDGTEWTVACLTFYRGQETKIRELLREYTKQPNKYSQFEKDKIKIVLYTVDKFQGREADITFLSMVQTNRDGFMDNPNRLNVALTRAKYQRVVIGKRNYFLYRSSSDQLKNLAAKAAKMD
ncbi:hypothetical protein CN481_15655 [Bacillus sp. AFS006103]|nr:hypothetical protein CN481_15655 [Bacillus sp. AFS006103]